MVAGWRCRAKCRTVVANRLHVAMLGKTMKPIQLTVAGTALMLAGCAGLPGDGFAHLEALADSGDVGPQIELAHVYANPSLMPGNTRQPDMLLAVKWCYIASALQTARATPACADVMAKASPYDRWQGMTLGDQWLQGLAYNLMR